MKSKIILIALLLSSSLTFAKVDPPCVYELIDFGSSGMWLVPDAPGCGGAINLMVILSAFFGW